MDYEPSIHRMVMFRGDVTIAHEKRYLKEELDNTINRLTTEFTGQGHTLISKGECRVCSNCSLTIGHTSKKYESGITQVLVMVQSDPAIENCNIP